jgi:hypothetical protein
MAITQLNSTNGGADALQYSVVKNHGATKIKGVDVYNARVTTPTKSLLAVAETMQREGSKYQPHEIVGILTQFGDVVARLVNEGNAVNVGSLMKIRPTIKGSFSAEDDNYTEGSQRIVVKTTVGTLLRNVAAKANVRRIDGKTAPEILSVLDTKSGEENAISSEGFIIVTGKHFEWNATQDDEGFFIIVDGVEHKLNVVGDKANKTMVTLETNVSLTAGDEVTLIFRTAKDSAGDPDQYVYGTPLTAM